ncbi:zinc finger domain-containing protein [Streptomyces chilikensis]|uniref:zinc finger domain-containing protein n=1 Tax=Streptomyces chilikensis TaxID=1194079 RepID=UPI003F4D1882
MTHYECPERGIPCPWCKAPTGQSCTTPRGRAIGIASHAARHEKWLRLEVERRAVDQVPAQDAEPLGELIDKPRRPGAWPVARL